MPFVYAVRCNFSDPGKEQAWNDWYSGPKLRQMLAKPMFLTGQRFAAAGLDKRRRYLALWCVESPEAFRTPEYTSDWGFFEWKPYITDWTRDLYQMPAVLRPEDLFVAPTEALYLASFEGIPDDAAETAMGDVAAKRPGTAWLKAAGLDRDSPYLGLRRLRNVAELGDTAQSQGANETVFAPISEFARGGV